MRHDAGDFLMAQYPQQAGGRRDRRVFRISSGGECVRLVVLNDIDAWHRQIRPVGELAHQPVIARRIALSDLPRAIHGQDHPVRIPVGENVHRQRDGECDQHSGFAAQHRANGEKQRRHCRQKDSCTQDIHRVITTFEIASYVGFDRPPGKRLTRLDLSPSVAGLPYDQTKRKTGKAGNRQRRKG